MAYVLMDGLCVLPSSMQFSKCVRGNRPDGLSKPTIMGLESTTSGRGTHKQASHGAIQGL